MGSTVNDSAQNQQAAASHVTQSQVGSAARGLINDNRDSARASSQQLDTFDSSRPLTKKKEGFSFSRALGIAGPVGRLFNKDTGLSARRKLRQAIALVKDSERMSVIATIERMDCMHRDYYEDFESEIPRLVYNVTHTPVNSRPAFAEAIAPFGRILGPYGAGIITGRMVDRNLNFDHLLAASKIAAGTCEYLLTSAAFLFKTWYLRDLLDCMVTMQTLDGTDKGLLAALRIIDDKIRQRPQHDAYHGFLRVTLKPFAKNFSDQDLWYLGIKEHAVDDSDEAFLAVYKEVTNPRREQQNNPAYKALYLGPMNFATMFSDFDREVMKACGRVLEEIFPNLPGSKKNSNGSEEKFAKREEKFASFVDHDEVNESIAYKSARADYYAELGISTGRGELPREEVREARRSRLLAVHPDKGGSQEAMQAFNAIEERFLGAREENHGAS